MSMALVAAFVLTIFGTETKASAFTKTKYGMTIKGENTIAKTKGSAWGSVSPQSYISINSVYKYKNKSGTIKTVPTDRTGAGNSTGASWSYSLPAGGVSKSINTKWTGIYDGHELTQEEKITY